MMDISASSEDHYDSRARARARAGNVGAMAKPSPLPPSGHPSPAHFDPFSNFFNSSSTLSPHNPLLNLDNPIGSMNSQLQAIESNVVQAPKGNLTLPSDHPSPASVRKPRKRARASRRAPTTVLTTDTSNFRAMVQEFTGIPAPPFTHPGSSFPRPRLDLFGATSILNLPQVPNINLAPNTTDSHRNLHHFQTDHQQPFHGSVLPPSRGSGGGADQALFLSMNQKYYADSKLNKYSASSSSSLDFHGDKGLENVTARNEGIIQSWICSSD